MIELAVTYPVFAWLLLAVPAIWFWPSRPRSATHGVLRTLILVLTVAALTQPVLVSSRSSEHHVVVLDQSDSVSDEARREGAAAARDLVSRLDGQGTVAVVQLGGAQALTENTLTENTIALQAGGGSPLGDALALAAQSIPHGMRGSITLVTDGLSTDRHWSASVAQLVERGMPVHTYDLYEAADDVFISDVRSSDARVGESVAVRVDVVGTGADLEVLLISDGETVARSGPFASDGRRSVAVQFEARRAGFIDLEAELVAERDSYPDNNTFEHILAVQEPVRILYLGERQRDAATRLSTLLGAGFDIETGAGRELGGSSDFSVYDLVMLDDLPARSLPEDAQQALADAVKNDGVGLLHSGGEAAFADGGYFATAVAGLLPVELAGDEDKIDPSVGLAIILDTSGSMAGTRIELAKHIARIAVRRLQPHDRIGIVEFYGNKHWAVPMQPASNKIEIDRAIGRMQAIGGTVLYPAVQEAYYGLLNVNTRYKHILVITDAGIEDSNYEAMIRRMSRDRINLSTILVGQGGHNQIMSDMANWGQGRFYSVGNQFQLVELILKQPSTKKPSRYRQGVFGVEGLGGRGWWAGVDNTALPPLNAYVEVERRDGAEVLIEAQHRRHPVLATWRYGLGRVTAFMSEPIGAGTEGWSDWDGYAEFLGRVLARTAADNTPFDLALARRHDVVTLTARRNLRDESSTPTAYLLDADGGVITESPVAFREYAPGLFEADIPTQPDAAVRAVVDAGKRGLQRVAARAGSDTSGERQVDPALALDLNGLSALTGGTALAPADIRDGRLAAGSGELSFVVTRIWPWLLLLALSMYLAELLYRRWPREAA